MKEADFGRKIDKKLAILADKLDNLIKVVAIAPRFETYFKDKKKGTQIKILSDLGLSREVVALMVGTTPESVSSTLSQIKSKQKKGSRLPKKEEVKKDE